MDLNIFSLKVFLKVAEVRSFTKAAEELFLTQPAVSLQIQKLEQIFQMQLFIRPHSGHISLTQGGEALKPHAEEMLSLHNNILVSMSKHSPALQKTIRIATCCIAGEHLIPLGLSDFQQTHPETSPSLTITKCENVFEGLLQGSFDIGVTGLAPKARELGKTLLLKTQLLFFAGPADNAQPHPVSVKQLPDLRLILREKGAGCRTGIEKFCEQHGLSPKELNVIIESESNEAIIQLVKKGYGVSALPRFMIQDDIARGKLSEVIFQEGYPLQSFYLVYPKSAPQSPLLRNLLATLKEFAIKTASRFPEQE